VRRLVRTDTAAIGSDQIVAVDVNERFYATE